MLGHFPACVYGLDSVNVDTSPRKAFESCLKLHHEETHSRAWLLNRAPATRPSPSISRDYEIGCSIHNRPGNHCNTAASYKAKVC
ncbi:uncharacterized protein MYCFIDRAFT_173188 [Pseudocercospora fijiensis CIRAD86]|uniref:Uncharacterized protein n=1 Tax=Pseudocercospora fijiensis (strain CIRAD86) TaxID=383855 RepID=M2Z2R6_PSEFD|nr:uncharacterized protein MYCFIDRAFT_173188 [Pseudocercospora fijiensis CIRAD86]EME84145.1 hypothetical protein MYCFIDRAFT_173188 [Pseudocercospora fijiensis CIRAD86]